MKYFVLIVGLFLIISCSETQEQKMQKSIRTAFKKEIDHTSSYEIDNFKISGSITVGERRKVMNELRLNELIDLQKKFAEIGMATNDIISSKIQLKKEMAFLKDEDIDQIAVYYVDFIVRSANKTGTVIKKDYSATVLNDENLTVVHLKSMN